MYLKDFGRFGNPKAIVIKTPWNIDIMAFAVSDIWTAINKE